MIKLLFTLAASCATAIVLAEETLGTKADLVAPPTQAAAPSGPGLGQFLPMLLALGIILGLLKFALPKAMAKFNRRLTTPLNSPILLEESASLAAGSLQVVTVRGKSLLLAITPQGVSCLATLDPTPTVADEPAFFELLDQEFKDDKSQTMGTPDEARSAKKAKHPAARSYAQSNQKITQSNDSESVTELTQDRFELLQKIVNS